MIDLDRMISFAEVDITHIGKYTVTKVKPDEISWDGEIMTAEEIRDILNNTDYAMVDNLPEGRD